MPHDDAEKSTIARTILEAHRSLMEMNDQNREVFSNVVRFMEKEVTNNENPD
jgi:hypothetical protein